MSNFTYALLDDSGLEVRRVFVYQDELTPGQMGDMNLIPFVQDSYDHDEATMKIAGEEIVVLDGTAHRQAIFVPRDAGDFYKDALAMRESALPAPAERDETVFALLNRLVQWVVLQADPALPHTVFEITAKEQAVLDHYDATFDATPIPPESRKVEPVGKKGAQANG